METTGAELASVLGRASDWRATALTHNRRNEITRGIWRVTLEGGSAVLKIVTRRRGVADARWAASDDPAHWNYWGREPLHALRDRLVTLVESSPRTLCHLDVWPANEVARPDGTVALLDWAFTGIGALGEDVGNHVPDSMFDLFLPAAQLAELDEVVYNAYVDGLRESGWCGDPRWVRLAMCASAVKYDWLAALMLTNAGRAQLDYGGEQPVDGDRRYSQRGQALLFLDGWVSEALRLADELGV